jgi:hypothetical protein
MPSVPPLTTGPTALAAHRRGVEHLLHGRPCSAADALREAVTEDRCFVVGQAVLALALAELEGGDDDEARGALSTARACSRMVSRYERHVAEVVALALDDRLARALVLAAEHLSEFPDDEVVRYVQRRWCEPGGQRP